MRILPLLALLVVACAPCPERAITPTNVCHQVDGGALLPNQPFVVTAANYGSGLEGASCAVSVDGGAITLTMSGLACPAKPSNNPVVPVTQTRCTVPALPTGSYTLNDPGSTTLNVGGADAGTLAPCNG